jgi:2-hydroxyacyl-CoA lyase 1
VWHGAVHVHASRPIISGPWHLKQGVQKRTPWVGVLFLLCRPLIVIGKGAAFSQADASLRDFVAAFGIPFLATAMGRGVVPDDNSLCANAARSAALRGADVAIIFGAR